MMDEMSTPTVYLETQVLKCANILKKHGKHVPDLIMAGGFISETQIYKAIAMSNYGDGNGPLVKAVLMARSPLTAVMKSSYFAQLAKEGRLARTFADRFGTTPDTFFIAVPELKKQYGERANEIPWEAVGLYTYLYDRIGVGLKQLLAGSRKWKLNLISRKDLMALTERAAKVTGVPLAEDAEAEEIERILE
jgi:hypothetical protein